MKLMSAQGCLERAASRTCQSLAPQRFPQWRPHPLRDRCGLQARVIPGTHAPVLQEQEKKSRVKGTDAVKANIQAAKAVSRVLRTSLGPKGMDKLLQGPDGDIVISELGAAPAAEGIGSLRRERAWALHVAAAAPWVMAAC